MKTLIALALALAVTSQAEAQLSDKYYPRVNPDSFKGKLTNECPFGGSRGLFAAQIYLQVLHGHNSSFGSRPNGRRSRVEGYCHGAVLALSRQAGKISSDWNDVYFRGSNGVHISRDDIPSSDIDDISWCIENDPRWPGDPWDRDEVQECMDAWNFYNKWLDSFSIQNVLGISPEPPKPAWPINDISEERAEELVNAFRGSHRPPKPRQLSESEQRSEQRARSLVDAFKEK